MTPSIWLALTAGVLSFLSPCVLPLLPIYLAILGAGDGRDPGKKTAFFRACLFVLGFSLVFVLMGLGASSLGKLLISQRLWWTRIGGVIVLLFGLHQTGLIHLGFLYRERRMAMPVKDGTILGAFLMGLIFAAGWTPCVGPVLASILAMAWTTGRAVEGAVLLAVYSVGLGLPFLLASLGIAAIRRRLESARRIVRAIELTSGVLLILLGLLLILDKANWLTLLS